MKESLNSARATVRAASARLGPSGADRVLREWETQLVRRVGTVVGRSILTRVLNQRSGTGRPPAPEDLSPVLDGLLQSAAAFLSKSECTGFAAALAESAAAVAREDEP